MKCMSCGKYFKLTQYHNSDMCFECEDTILDDDALVELSLIANPNGRTVAKIEEDDYSSRLYDSD